MKIPDGPRWLAVLVAVAALAGSAAGARADEARSVIVWGEGADGEELASRVASHLAAPYVARDASALRRALASARAPSLAVAAKDRGSDARLVARVRLSASAAHAEAAVLLSVRKSRRATALHVWLVDAKGEGSAEVDREIALGAGASIDEEADAAWNAVAQAFPAKAAPVAPTEATAAPASAPPASSPATDASSAPATDEDRGAPAMEPSAAQGEHTRAGALASVGVAIQAGSRGFAYVDRLTPTLRPYNLFMAPLASVDAELYPLARAHTPVLKDLGVTFDYALAFGLASADSAGTSVSTSWNAFDVGARERIALGRSVLAGIHGGYGAINYSFGNALGTNAQLPDVGYRFVRGGLDVRVALGGLSLYAFGSYLDVLSTGSFGTLFPRASVTGVEGRIGAAQAVAGGLEISLDLSYTRFAYSLRPQPGDRYVAGGALDEMSRASLGLAYLF